MLATPETPMAQVRPLVPPPLFDAPGAAHPEQPGSSAATAAAAASAAQQPPNNADRAAGETAAPAALQDMQVSQRCC